MTAYKDKEASRKYHNEWYHKHKQVVMEQRKQRQVEIRDWYRNYKSTLCCADCGECHPACLQFHHKDRTEKRFSPGDMANRASSINVLMKEINKCEVLCVNCHAKHHWRESHAIDNWEEMLPLEE